MEEVLCELRAPNDKEPALQLVDVLAGINSRWEERLWRGYLSIQRYFSYLLGRTPKDMLQV